MDQLTLFGSSDPPTAPPLGLRLKEEARRARSDLMTARRRLREAPPHKKTDYRIRVEVCERSLLEIQREARLAFNPDAPNATAKPTTSPEEPLVSSSAGRVSGDPS